MHKLTLNPNNWTFEDYSKYLAALLRSNWQEAFQLLMKIVVAWDYDVPLGPNAYEDLPFSELKEITESVKATLETFQEGLDTSKVQVDMSKWKMRDFFAFQTAARTNDLETLETLMKKVARMRGVERDKRLTFEQGALLSKAISAAIQGMFGQGN